MTKFVKFALVSLVILLVFDFNIGMAQDVSGTMVYHEAGKKTVHVKDCKRLGSTKGKTVMTLAEAEAKGLRLCSQCPVDDLSEKKDKEDQGSLPESWVNPPPDQHAAIPVHSFVPSERAPLVSMGEDGRLVYKPYSDKGDRIMDWSHCGYENSEVPIPDVPLVETLHPLPGDPHPFENMFYPVGPDNREQIQAALDRVEARKPGADGSKGAVLLKKGTYYIDGSLKVGSGVVLRGEGDDEDGTVLIFNTSDGGNAIEIEGEGPIEESDDVDKIRITQDYLPSGSISLNVEHASRFQPGDFVCVKKTVNEKWIEDLGMGERLRHIRGGKEGAKKRPWKPESYQFKHIRQIRAVSGNTITLDMVLPQSFEKQHGGGEVYKVSVDKLGSQSGVEYLRIVSNYDTTVTNNKKSTNFSNFWSGIVLENVSDSWVRNCTMMHFVKSAVSIGDNTLYVTVRDCKSLQPVGPVAGGRRYPYSINGGTGHLVYQCYTEDGRHDFAGGSRTMGPFAFVKCTAVRGGTSEPHHRWGTGYLFDCITTDGSIGAFNRGDSGSGHGWAASNTLVWNANAQSVTVFDPETTGENNFAIGFTGEYIKESFEPMGLWYANTRAGYWGTPHEGKYYGYALMGNGYIESPDKQVEPASLFVQQLIDRIGKEQAMKVLQKQDPGQSGPKILFEDSMMSDWQENWLLDGKKATLEHRDNGLYFSGGTVTKRDDPEEYHAHHAVLWTKKVFEGDLRITYEMTRIDTSNYGNTLLYIQAQGTGSDPYVKDIAEWSGLRQIPAMSLYFEHMDLISLSFRENLRCKRYPWKDSNGEWYPNRGLIEPMVDYTGMIPGKKYSVEVEKRASSVTLRLYDAGTKALLTDFTWDTTKVPEELEPIQKGRIGLRHMSTKQFVYRNFKVEQL